MNNRQKENISETYGEILYESIDKLLAEVCFSDQDVFFDLGSGLGKAVVQVFLRSTVKESCGIEIIPELHQISLTIEKKIQQELPDFYTGGRKLTFLLGSFLDIPFSEASIVLIGSPCFSQKLLRELGKMIDCTTNIHTVLTLRPITTLTRLSFTKAIRIECSWDSALCYIYKKQSKAGKN